MIQLGRRRTVDRGRRRARGAWVVPAGAALLAPFLLLSAGQAGAAQDPAATAAQPYVSGLLSTNGSAGPGLYDPQGRAVLLHGVNAVYKRAPYVLYVDPGKPWNFDDADAAQIAGMGFNVVRLGILWQGIEPGKLKPNNPAVCAKGKPGDPHQWNQAVADRYIGHLVDTVNLLGRHKIYSLVDMHQDVYSEVFRGEGAPAWAVCSDGRSLAPLPGRWSNTYASPALNAAFQHFWLNDVVGNLQGEYTRSWIAVARALDDNPWVAGYDLMNEPYTASVAKAPNKAVDEQLQCFYAGSATPGTYGPNYAPIHCDPGDTPIGLIPAIQAVDPHHLIFLEPTIFERNGQANFIGRIPYPNLVITFHVYCGARSPVTGNPTNSSECFNEVNRHFTRRQIQVAENSSPDQPGGLPLFMGEFGATHDPELVSTAAVQGDQFGIGWAYWSWKYYGDPTGSSNEALVSDNGKLYPQASSIDEAYPIAVAGTVVLDVAGVNSPRLLLQYNSDPRIDAPTLIHVPVGRFPHGYCAEVVGAKVISAPDAPTLEIANPPSPTTITVAVFGSGCAYPAVSAPNG